MVIGMPGFDVQGLLADLCDAFYFAAFLGGFQGVVDGVHFGLGVGGRGGFEGGVALGGFGARVAFGGAGAFLGALRGACAAFLVSVLVAGVFHRLLGLRQRLRLGITSYEFRITN